MATRTATVCAGQTNDGPDDCGAFARSLADLKGYTIVTHGNPNPPATSADFNDCKNRTVAYWSGHGKESDDGEHYELQGTSWFKVGPIMSGWDTNDPLIALFLASCNALSTAHLRTKFADMMKRTRLFVICGYRKTAPGSNKLDVTIVNNFFDHTNAGRGVISAWKEAHGGTGREDNWGALSYGGLAANYHFTLPGWGDNSGVSNYQQPIYYIYQDGSPLVWSPSTNISNANELPYQVMVSETPVSLNTHSLGDCTTIEKGESITSLYRLQKFEPVAASSLRKMANQCMVKIGAIPQMPGIISTFSPVYREEVLPTPSDAGDVIGGDMVYQQSYNGIPLNQSFLRICLDKDGVYNVTNKLCQINRHGAVMRSGAIMSVDDAKRMLPGYSAIAVKHSQYVYADAGNGVYKLCHELTMADGLKYLVDTRTGEVM